MRNAFADYVTSTAFNLHLSKAQVEGISLLVGQLEINGPAFVKMRPTQYMDALQHKGILRHEYGIGYGLTSEGRLVLPLLFACGLLKSKHGLLELCNLPIVTNKHTAFRAAFPAEAA